MWKNVFIESCILSALIFGGFYFNASHLKNEISGSQETRQNDSEDKYIWTHVSGVSEPNEQKSPAAHLSGTDEETPVPPISGVGQPPLKSPR